MDTPELTTTRAKYARMKKIKGSEFLPPKLCPYCRRMMPVRAWKYCDNTDCLAKHKLSLGQKPKKVKCPFGICDGSGTFETEWIKGDVREESCLCNKKHN